MQTMDRTMTEDAGFLLGQVLVPFPREFVNAQNSLDDNERKFMCHPEQRKLKYTELIF